MHHAAASIPEPRLFAEMNTTPLIDVLLVLLIMFILLVPTVTHKVAIDLPGRGAAGAPTELHRLQIAASGAIVLDGSAIEDGALPSRLAAIAARDGAVLQLQTHPEARYERFDQLLAVIKRAGVTRLGFVGNDRFGRW